MEHKGCMCINKALHQKDLINREKHFIRNSDNFWVDRKGRVFHLDGENPKRWTVCECVYEHTEYPYVLISYSGTFRKVYMHRLMAEMFISNPNQLPVVMHKNNDKSNFDISNLKWGTQSENVAQAYADGLFRVTQYTKGKLTIKGICEDLELGMPPVDISKKYDVSQQYVQSIKTRRIHKDISKIYKF